MPHDDPDEPHTDDPYDPYDHWPDSTTSLYPPGPVDASAMITLPLSTVVGRQRMYHQQRQMLRDMLDWSDAVINVLGVSACCDLHPAFEVYSSAAGCFGMANASLRDSCDACGVPLIVQDAIGAEAFAIGPYTHVCAGCFTILSPRFSSTLRQHARLAALAHEFPNGMATVIMAALAHRQWSMADAITALDLNERRFTQLLLIDQHIWNEPTFLDALVTLLHCQREPLRALISDGIAALAAAQDRDRH